MVQDNRKWTHCGYCGREHLEGPCPQYSDEIADAIYAAMEADK